MYYGNYTAFYLDTMRSFILLNLSLDEMTPELLNEQWMFVISYETVGLIRFYVGIAKGFGYPVGLLMQILAMIYLVRGNSGYSRSARNWFLLVLGADISSTLFRMYELLTQDFIVSNPALDVDPNARVGDMISYLLWGLRRIGDALAQDVICRLFFILLYFPIHLSPIALTVSSLIRCYCVRFPLRAKATLATCVDRCLVALTVLLSLGISVVIAALVSKGQYNRFIKVNAFGLQVNIGNCPIQRYNNLNTNKELMFIGLNFMLATIFVICALNFISALVIIFVLFQAKKARKAMSATELGDSGAEERATAMLLGMNVTLFVCFFVSRLLLVVSTRINVIANPIGYALVDRFAVYLFNVPYYTNMIFIVGLSRKFYEFFLPWLAKKKTMKAISAVSLKTVEESRLG